MATNKKQTAMLPPPMLVPPPPPEAQQQDDDFSAFFQPQQTAAPTNDEDFSAYFQQAPSAPQPGAAPLPAASVPVVSIPQLLRNPETKVTKSKETSAKTAPQKKEETEAPSPTEQLLNDIGSAVMQTPYVGPAIAAAQAGINTAARAGREAKRSNGESALAALISAPAGIAQIQQDLARASTQTIPAIGGALGIPPDQIKQMQQMALAHPEMNNADALRQEKHVKAYQDKYPASSATGEFAGAAALPLGSLTKAVGLVPAIAEGAGYGGGFSALGALARQAQQGKPADIPAALNEAVPGAILGAGLGGLVHTGAEALGGVMEGKSKKTSTETAEAQPTPEPEAPKEPGIKMADGTVYPTAADAVAAAHAPGVPEDQKQAILKAVVAHTEAQAATPKIDNPFALFKKGEHGQVTKLIGDLIPKSTSMDDLNKLSDQAATWVDKNVKQTDIRKEMKDQISDVRDKAKTRIETLEMAERQRQANEQAAATKAQQAASPPQPKPEANFRGGGVDMNAKPNEPTPDVFAKPQPEREPTPHESESNARAAAEKKQFPLHDQTFGSVAEGTYWKPKDLTDSQLQDTLDALNEKSNTNLEKRGDAKIIDALVQEKMRRAQRDVKGLEKDWTQDTQPEMPQDGHPSIDEIKNMTDVDQLRKIGEDPNAHPEKAAAAYERWDELESQKTEPTPQTNPEEPDLQSNQDRFVVQPHPDKKGYWQTIDTQGEHPSSESKSRKQQEQAAQNFNSGKSTPGQGRKKAGALGQLIPGGKPKETEPTRSDYVSDRLNHPEAKAAGEALAPEHQQQFTEAAKAKTDYQDAEAQTHAAISQFFHDLGKDVTSNKNTADEKLGLHREINAMLESKGLPPLSERDNTYMDAVTAKKPGYESYDFRNAKTVRQRIAEIKTLADKMSDAKQKWDAARTPLTEAMKAGDLPENVTIGKGDTAANFRLNRPSEGSGKFEDLPEHIQQRVEEMKDSLKELAKPKSDANITIVDKFGKALEKMSPDNLDSLVSDLKGSTSVDEALRLVLAKDKNRTISNFLDDVATNLVQGSKGITHSIDPVTATVIAIAKTEEAKTGGKAVTDLVKAGFVNALAGLKKTFDYIYDYDRILHQQLSTNIAKENIVGLGIKFKTGDDPLISKSLRMDPEDILAGEQGLNKLTPEQRTYLAQRKALRQESARLVRKAAADLLENRKVESLGELNIYDRQIHHILNSLDMSLTGRREITGDPWVNNLADQLQTGMYDYIFKWNPAMATLHMVDPFIIGSSRAGLGRVLKAKALLQTDAAVKEFIGAMNGNGPIEDFRAEQRSNTRQGERNALQKVTDKINDLPDFPTAKWNAQDMFASGFILHGDSIGYKGGGVKFLRDLATGKIKGDDQLAAFVKAIEVVNDTTGAGMYGLNKDLVARNPILKNALLFTSVQFRWARLAVKYADQMRKGDLSGAKSLGTLMAMMAVFGGRAAIPDEVREGLKAAGQRDLVYAMEDICDSFNLVKHLPIVGRDMTDKLTWQLMPFLGVRTHALLDEARSTAEAAGQGNFGKALMGSLMISVPMVLAAFHAEGGAAGGATITRAIKEAGNALANKKTIYVGTHNYAPIMDKMIGTGTQKPYNMGDAFLNTVGLGYSPEVGEAVKYTRRNEESMKEQHKRYPGTEPAFNGLLRKKREQ